MTTIIQNDVSSYTLSSFASIEDTETVFNTDVTIKGKLTVDGVLSLDERIAAIEKRLGILVPVPLLPDPDLLKQYEALQEAHQAYKELEEQYRSWDMLKK